MNTPSPIPMQLIHAFTTRIDQITQDFQAEFGALSPQEINYKPTPSTWSIGQNIDHVIQVNRTYFPLVGKLKKGTYQKPFIGHIGFIVKFFGKSILSSVQPTEPKKIKTFPIWEPETSDLPGDILDTFAKHQEDLKKMISDCAPLLEKGAVIASPASRFIVYKLETAFEIILAHEARHLEQAKRVMLRLRSA